MSVVPALIFFFFQAEDGIRDLYLTGVQTCALPICRAGAGAGARLGRAVPHARKARVRAATGAAREQQSEFRYDAARRSVARHRFAVLRPRPHRSEERRVGKEYRSRWSPDG